MYPGTSSQNQRFSLLCWNIHKEMGRPAFRHLYGELMLRYTPELVLLQEADIGRNGEKLFDGYLLTGSANVRGFRGAYGVLTASRSGFRTVNALRTRTRELFVTTRKHLIMTTHTLPGGAPLTVVNIHAINFTSTRRFIDEIARLYYAIKEVQGALIVAGDFNTWNEKRLAALTDFSRLLTLQKAPLFESHHIRKQFAKPLDHLYYRGLSLVEARALDTGRISDHNPIVATFELV